TSQPSPDSWSARSSIARVSASSSTTRIAMVPPMCVPEVDEQLAQGRRARGLLMVRLRTGGEHCLLVGWPGDRAQNQDRDRRRARIGAQLGEQCGRLTVGQVEVEHDERWPRCVVVGKKPESGGGGGDGDGPERHGRESPLDGAAEVRI